MISSSFRVALILGLSQAPTLAHARPGGEPTFDLDRQAILGMLGEYQVGFHFQETVALAPGYAIKPAKDSGGFEVVILVEDSGRKIVLQHLLVSEGGHVTKHWRQDWTFEATERFEFSADQTWTHVPLAPEVTRGAWTQCVFEVSDAPRYCGTGTWNHRDGNPTWTSDRTWRPLPRREYTTRSDYNAINAENRHTLTPTGWTHEQDNSKVVRSAGESRVLTREFGFNDYQRITGHDFAPAYAYWKKTQAYWTRVRAAWAARLAQPGAVVLQTPVDGMPIIEALFGLAEQAQAGTTISDAKIAEVFARYVAQGRVQITGDSGATKPVHH